MPTPSVGIIEEPSLRRCSSPIAWLAIAAPLSLSSLLVACSTDVSGGGSSASSPSADGDGADDSGQDSDDGDPPRGGRDPGSIAKDGGANPGEDVEARGPAPEKDTDPKDTTSVDDPDQCAAIRKEAPPGHGATDLVFLLDTSATMIHAILQVQANLSMFVQSFANSSADTRVVMITDSDPAQGFPLESDASRYRFISSIVDSKQLFDVAILAFPQYKEFLRPNAITQFVMITDDNDRRAPESFKQEMERLLGHEFIQHAIAAPADEDGLPCLNETAVATDPLCAFYVPGLGALPGICSAAAIGEKYFQLAEDTGGRQLSICKSDWSVLFSDLEEAVIEAVPLPCDYSLDDAAGETFDPTQVSIVYGDPQDKEVVFPKAIMPGACGDKVGWFYDDNAAPKSITLCPSACERVRDGGKIDIAFGCEPPLLL